MDEVLKPSDDVLAALATQMGLPAPAPAPESGASTAPSSGNEKRPASPPHQKSYSQLT